MASLGDVQQMTRDAKLAQKSQSSEQSKHTIETALFQSKCVREYFYYCNETFTELAEDGIDRNHMLEKLSYVLICMLSYEKPFEVRPLRIKDDLPKLGKTDMEKLERSLWSFYRSQVLSPEELKERNDVKELIDSCLVGIVPEPFTLRMFGGVVTQTSTHGGDVDLDLTFEENKVEDQERLKDMICEKLNATRLKRVVHYGKKVPIIHQLDGSHQFTFDITFNRTTGPLSAQILNDYFSVLPELRPVALFLKHWGKSTKFVSGKKTLLSSHAITVMAITRCLVNGWLTPLQDPEEMKKFRRDQLRGGFSKDRNEEVLWVDPTLIPQPSYHPNAAEILCDFFNFYGCLFDYATEVSPRKRNFFFKPRNVWVDEASTFFLEDLVIERNIGKMFRPGKVEAMRKQMVETYTKFSTDYTELSEILNK